MKSCPFCAEEIQEEAKKCKHCGEWLDGSKKKVVPDDPDKGSSAARAVTKGLKQKQYDETKFGCLGLILLLVSITIGVVIKSFWIGFFVFIVPMTVLSVKYYKE